MNIIVGVADMKVSNNPEARIVTYSLGSCIGVAVYDFFVKVGGILHFMLPESRIDEIKAKNNPFMFADTGIPALFKSTYKLGAKKQRMKIAIVGGSQIMDQNGFFNIGKRNHMAVRKIFWKNNVIPNYEEVGGNVNRTVGLTIKDGNILIKVSDGGEKII